MDYNFVSLEQFRKMDKSGELLESGNYEGNHYGTPKPPPNPPSNTIPAYSRSPLSSGYIPKDPIMPIDSLSPAGNASTRRSTRPPIQAAGPLPSNWEIAYTETNEKYFIE